MHARLTSSFDMKINVPCYELNATKASRHCVCVCVDCKLERDLHEKEEREKIHEQWGRGKIVRDEEANA